MASTRTTNFETRVNYIYKMINIGITDKELLMMVFTGYESKEDHFPIVINGTKVSMNYLDVQSYNRKNNTNFELRYTKIGNIIKNRNFDKMLELHNSGDLSLNKIYELMKEADTYREFVLRKKKYS